MGENDGYNADIGMLVKHLSVRLETTMNQQLEKMELTHSQAWILHYLLHRQGQRVTIKDLSDVLRQSHVTVVGVLRRMVQKGYVTITVDPVDKRYRNVAATEKAVAAEAALEENRLLIEARMLQGFSPEALVQLRLALQRLTENLEG